MGFFSYGVVDVSTCNSFSHFGCNLLFEVDSILTFGRFASCWPFSLPLCLVTSLCDEKDGDKDRRRLSF
jgi:hypothetical protein